MRNIEEKKVNQKSKPKKKSQAVFSLPMIRLVQNLMMTPRSCNVQTIPGIPRAPIVQCSLHFNHQPNVALRTPSSQLPVQREVSLNECDETKVQRRGIYAGRARVMSPHR